MADEWTTFEDYEALSPIPARPGRYDSHVFKVAKRWQVFRSYGLHGWIIPYQIEPASAGGIDISFVDLLGEPLGMAIAVSPSQVTENIVRSIPMSTRTVGQIYNVVPAGPASGGKAEGSISWTACTPFPA